MNFSDILASIIHDMKNSLGMVINTLEEITSAGDDANLDKHKIPVLQHEAKRLSNNLIELLTLYKIENERITASIDEVHVDEFLEEIVIDNQVFAQSKDVSLEYQCEPELTGFFDEGLVRGVINNLIGNGLRYTGSQMLIVAGMIDDHLVIQVEDDGEGYPQSMLDAQAAFDRNESFVEGHTQLGIYFAGMVARLHKNREKKGFIRLSNGNHLKGGCFSIWLP